MSFRVLSTSPTFGHYVAEPVDYLKNRGYSVDLIPRGKKFSEEEMIRIMADYDAAIVGVEKMTAAVIQAAKKLRIIAKHGAGVDNIDVEAATARGIVVTSAPGTNSDSVADLTLGLFLSLARRIPFADQSIRTGGWPRLVGFQLFKKVLGIIGLGDIGKRVAKRAAGFEMSVNAYDVVRDDAFARQWGITYLPLDELLASADFISIHVPSIPATLKMIGERELRLMKKEAFLVNISRGDVVDEEALCRVLKERGIQGAALDVFSSEPPKESPLFALDNVVLSPHMGAYTYEALRETGMICAKGITDLLEGKRPSHVVNPEVLKS
jgi:D-3-phosphoglycerate dehydrogenase